MGVDTDKLQQWQYASNFIDTSVETITGSMTKLTKKMDSAQEEEKKNAEKWQEHLDKIARGEKSTWEEATTARDAYVKLGVSWKDYNGNLRDNEEVFMDLIDALGNKECSNLSADLTKRINTAKSDWVMNGFTDADWDAFQNDLKAYGLDKYLEIHQKYLDAYFAG